MLIAMPTANNPRHEQSSATGEHAGDCGSGCPDKVAMVWVSPGERVGRTERACWRPIPETPFDRFAGPILSLASGAVNGSQPGVQVGKWAGRSGLALILRRVLQSRRKRPGNPGLCPALDRR